MYFVEDSREPPETNGKFTWRTRILDLGLTCLLFGVYRKYRQRLQSTRTRHVVHLLDFHEFIQGLLVEWAGEFLLTNYLQNFVN
jgi:hypothetical protein